MSYNELLLKFLDGINTAAARADIIATFSLLQEAYRAGRLDDNKLRMALKELCTDVLKEKYPTKSDEEINNMANEWVDKFYRAIRMSSIKKRLGISD